MQSYKTRNIVVKNELQRVFELFRTPKSVAHFVDKSRDRLPVTDLEISEDAFSFKTRQFGKVAFKRTEVEAPNFVKYEGTHAPLPIVITANMSEGEALGTTNLQISVEANIPSFLQGMVASKIEPTLEKVANIMEHLDVNSYLE